MSLGAREHRALEGIAEGLSAADPELAAMLDMFARLTSGEQMPARKEVRAPGRRRPAARPGQPGRGMPRGRHRARHVSPAAWLPAAVILIMTALIVVTATLTGAGNKGACGRSLGLACLSPVSSHSAVKRSSTGHANTRRLDDILVGSSAKPYIG